MLKQITSLQHASIKHLVKLRQNRDYRYEHHSLVIEGIKPLNELGKNIQVKLLMALDESLIPTHAKPQQTLIVSEEILQKASGLQHPEGILAEVEMPQSSTLRGLKSIIALDEINDPGNLGTLLRSALALGWEGAFIVKDSCDPYNEKALRASRGATFRLPIGMGSWNDLRKIVEENKLTSLVADLNGEDPSSFNSLDRMVLILSNEARGPSPLALENSRKVTIPMPGKMESLNVAVAGGILMYSLKKGK